MERRDPTLDAAKASGAKETGFSLVEALNRTQRSIIGEDLSITGNVACKGDVEVLGKVNGDVSCDALIIGKNGVVTGRVKAETMIINGTVSGPLEGSDVKLGSSARVVGDIRHRTLAIEQGAYFEGRAERLDAAGKTRSEAAAAPSGDAAGARSDPNQVGPGAGQRPAMSGGRPDAGAYDNGSLTGAAHPASDAGSARQPAGSVVPPPAKPGEVAGGGQR